MAKDDSSNWGRMAGTGFEFAVAILLFGAIGWWLDSLWGTKPWLLIVGCALGFFVGLWRMFKVASRSFRD